MEISDIFFLGELFEEVQLKNIFGDGKTFVDCIPVMEPAKIRNLFDEQKLMPGFDLAKFVKQYFIVPETNSAEFKSVAERPIKEHLEMLWNELTRQPEKSKSSLIALPFPYIVPGGRFREIYYWDSYFTMLGLQVSGRIDIIENMVDNFSYLIDHIGYIPNGNRTYYLGRSQPPFYACMVTLLSEAKGTGILIKYLPQLKKEYDFWMKGSGLLISESHGRNRVAMLGDSVILNHYRDENDTPRPESFKEDTELAKEAADKNIMYTHLRAAAESGWDFSSRWFKNAADFNSIHTAEIIPVDLNCLLFNLEKTIAKAFYLSGDVSSSLKYEKLANNRKANINKYCWNNTTGFYVDYDYVAREQKVSQTLAAAYPLFFEIASTEQAAGVAKVIQQQFVFAGGLISSTETTTQQWDAPNGWAPLQWITIQGLAKYGYHQLSKDIAQRWLTLNEKVYKDTGKMMEKYNVVKTGVTAGGGEYPAQDGFGWTNGVYLALRKWMDA